MAGAPRQLVLLTARKLASSSHHEQQFHTRRRSRVHRHNCRPAALTSALGIVLISPKSRPPRPRSIAQGAAAGFELPPSSLCLITPVSIRCGISAAIHGASPRHSACAMPKCGTFLAHSGLKWIVRQILPPRYIFAVLPAGERARARRSRHVQPPRTRESSARNVGDDHHQRAPPHRQAPAARARVQLPGT